MCPLDCEPLVKTFNSLQAGISLVIPGHITGPGVLDPLNISGTSKLTPLSWLRFSVSKILLHLQGGQTSFFKK
jgi:hypothetical protein